MTREPRPGESDHPQTMDAHLQIGAVRPSDFGIEGVRAKNFRFGYGQPVPAEIKRLPRAIETGRDADTWRQPPLPNMPFEGEHQPRPSGGSGLIGQDPPDELQNLHWNTLRGFLAAHLYRDYDEPTEEYQRQRKSAQDNPREVTAPTHEAQFGDYVLSRHESPAGDVIRAWDKDGNHVGGIQFSNPGWEHPGRVTHDRLYVMPEHQGQGLAAAMSRFAQFTHSGDPIRGVGISLNRTSDGDRFTDSMTGGKAEAYETHDFDGKEDFDRVHDALVDPNNDPTAAARAQARNGKQLRLFD